MSILNKLTTDGSSLSKLDGLSPSIPDFSISKAKSNLSGNGSSLSEFDGLTPQASDFSDSKLHDTYSTDGDPNIISKPSPSRLDPNSVSKYLDNLPR